MTKLFVVVLNFNGGKDIIECLNSLMGEKAEIVVVDNGSTDGSLEKLKVQSEKLKIAKIIENKKNLGFARGCNVGIKYALKNGAEAVLLLNQDTVVEKGFLKPLLENPADIVAPVIKFKRKGEWVYDFGGRVNWWVGRTTHLEFSHLGGVMASPPAGGSACHHPRWGSGIDYVSGCAMLIKRPVLEKIGLLDERYFLYEEDVDFCLKARKAGFKVVVEPKSIVIHKLSEGKEKPLKQHFSHLKSNFIFINQWIPVYKRPFAYGYLLALFFKIIGARTKVR
jgi:GT2 family glycosyltransferase